MSVRRVEPTGLSHAKHVIDDLRFDLRWTLDSVEVLTRNGQHAEARELLDAQEADLADAVRSLAHDTAIARRRSVPVATRSLAFAAAAAVLVLSVGVVVMRNSGATAPQTIAIGPADVVQTGATTSAPAVESRTPRAVEAKPTAIALRRGTVGGGDPPIVNNRVKSAVRADPPAIAATDSVSSTPLPSPLPAYLRTIS